MEPTEAVDLEVLLRAQQRSLMLDEHDGLSTADELGELLARVGVALRYGATASLPLASVYAAVRRGVPEQEPNAEAQRRATQLTHDLLERGVAIEINVIADRVGLVHADLAPALIALVRRNRGVDNLPVSDTGRRVLAFIAEQPRATAGQVRAHLGVTPGTWPNQADDALAELQRLMLIDRGATDVPATGAAYLGKDGIPYRLVDDVHRKLVRAAGKLDVPTAARRLLRTYLAGAVFVRPAKLAGMWKRLMTDDDLRAAIDALVRDGHARLAGARGDILIAR